MGTLIDEDGFVLLEMDVCTSFGETFEGIHPTTPISGLLSYYDSAACPDQLGMTLDEYYDQVVDRVVIWMENPSPSKPQCQGSSFYEPLEMYERMVQAGALAVVRLDIVAGKTPGIWYGHFTDEWVRETNHTVNHSILGAIPFLHCSTTDQESIDAFVEYFYDYPTVNQQAFPGGVNASFTPELNPFKPVFESTMYVVIMRVLMPLLLCSTALFGIAYLVKRVLNARRRRASVVNVPTVALAIESAAMIILGVYFAVDGLWAVKGSLLSPLRTTVLGYFMLLSTGTSILVGLSFSDFRRAAKSRGSGKSFVERHRTTLIVSASLMIVGEVVAAFTRRLSNVHVLVNASVIFLGFAVAFWFAYESLSFVWIMNDLSTKSANGPGNNARAHVREIAIWAGLSSVFGCLTLILGMVFNFVRHLIWDPHRWLWCFLVSTIFRCAYSFSKIALLRPPRAQNITQKHLLPQMGSYTDNRKQTKRVTNTERNTPNHSFNMQDSEPPEYMY